MPRQQAVGGVEVQALDHAVADPDGALALRIGVGEGVDDLQDFDAAAYAEALVGAPAAGGVAA